MARSFTYALLVALVALIFPSQLLMAQPDPGAPAGTVDGPRRAPGAAPTFPVPITPAPPGFYFGKIDWQAWYGEYTREVLQRTPRLPDGAITRDAGVIPTLPVILPSDATFIRSVKVLIEPNSYSATSNIDSANVTIYGSHVFRQRAINDRITAAAGSAPHETLANGVQVRVATSESGIDLTFTRWGAAYLISIECEDNNADTRCAESDYIKSLALNMAIAG